MFDALAQNTQYPIRLQLHVCLNAVPYYLSVGIRADNFKLTKRGETMTTLQKTLKEYRKKHKITQDQMAHQIGISQQGYAAYERGITYPSPTARLALVNIGIPKEVLVPEGYEPYYSATDAQRESAEELKALCRLISTGKCSMPTESRINRLKAAIADYEKSLAEKAVDE